MKSHTMSPLVSVIIPNYNHERFLAERLNSILGQTFQDFELIILDDASKDNSARVIQEIIAQHPHRLVQNRVNSGCPCAQWIQGILMAKGRYIWIAESDDTCETSFLDQMVTSLQNGGVLSYCRTKAIDSKGNPISGQQFWPDTFDSTRWKSSFLLSSRNLCRNFMARGNVIANASSVVFLKPTSDVLKKLAEATRGTRFTGDWLFWCHFLMLTPGLVSFESRELSGFRFHDQTTRKVESLGSVNRSKERQRFFEYSCAVKSILRVTRPWPRGYWLQLAARGYWDWIFSEYLFRFQPKPHEKLFITALHGPLRLGLYLRLLSSRSRQFRYWGSF
ncbi:glycosyltransferase family 2 protein [Cyanobium gracile]|nr:glycosyltransferase family 2 protein [Cyanobium gracile]